MSAEEFARLAICWPCKTVWVFDEPFCWGQTCGDCQGLLQPHETRTLN